MDISYNKLWKLLIDRGMNRGNLHELTGVSTATLARMSRREPVALTVLVRICRGLHCDIGDIVEILPEKSEVSQ